RKTMIASGAILAAVILHSSCGPGETPEQRVERLRYNHQLYPVATTTLYGENGEPTMLVDLQVVNQGTEPLRQLTVMVRVRTPDGTHNMEERVTLDLGDLRPGVGERISLSIPGVALGEEDEVTVELENNLPPEILHELPEFAEVAAASAESSAS
ncbi:MAG: hypothetical protein ACC742_11235, partial [Thermoanaerobaculales bacterium]